MPQIVVAALSSDEAVANELIDRLAGYGLPVTMLADSGPRAEQHIRQADALIIVISDQWFAQIEQAESQSLRRTLGIASTQSDMLIHLALIDNAQLPSVSQIPEDLRPLGYLPNSPLSTESFARDARAIGVKVNQHLKRVTAAGRSRSGTDRTQSRGGIPWNILILISALVVGLGLIVLPDLLNVDRDKGRVDLPAPRSAAANSAMILRGESIHLGISAGLSGQVMERGQTMVNGIELAVQQRPTLVIDGQRFPVDILTQDSACSSDGGLLVADLFTADSGVVGVIGPMCNIACFAAKGVYESADYATISPSCTASGLAEGTGRSFNRTISSASTDATLAAISVLGELGIERVAVISDEDIQDIAIADAVHLAIQESNLEVVARITFNPGSFDGAAVLTQIEEAKPQLVFFAGGNDEAVLVAQTLTGKPLILAAGVDMDAFITAMGADAENAITYARSALAGDAYDNFSEQYTTVFGTPPEGDISAYAYDATQLLLDGIEAVGRVDVIGNLLVDRVALQDFIRNYEGEGVTGTLHCQQTGDCAVGDITLLQVRDGQLVVFGAE